MEHSNIFSNLDDCLNLNFSEITEDLLNDAYNEVKNNIEKRKIFFSLLFSIGDITNRQHNIFVKKVQDGGQSRREDFYIIVKWLFKNHKRQFKKFLFAGLFNEYNCFDTLLRNRIKTKNFKIIKTYNLFEDKEYRKILVEYLSKIIRQGNNFDKKLISKFLSLPRLSKRKNHKVLKNETYQIMLDKVSFLKELSDELNWEYKVITKNNINFKGYRNWRRNYISNNESVLFSTQKILKFKKSDFLEWIEKVPGSARKRVQDKIFKNKKYSQLKEWYEEFQNEKLELKTKLKQVKEKQSLGEDVDLSEIKELEKLSKVTESGTTLNKIYEMIESNDIDNLNFEQFLEKINLRYDTLVVTDISYSMTENNNMPLKFAALISTICLIKNPNLQGSSIIGLYNDTCKWYSKIDQRDKSKNSIIKDIDTKVESFIDRTKTFYENYEKMYEFIKSKCDGATNVFSIANQLRKLSNVELEQLKQYPVWTLISDGEWNNSYSPLSSFREMQNEFKEVLGFVPKMICIDVNNEKSPNKELLNVNNLLYINTKNLSMLESVLTNYSDEDVFNSNIILKSIYSSNRYDLVRKNTL